jgi:hypothetical protein
MGTITAEARGAAKNVVRNHFGGQSFPSLLFLSSQASAPKAKKMKEFQYVLIKTLLPVKNTFKIYWYGPWQQTKG